MFRSNPLVVLSMVFALLGLIFLMITLVEIKKWKLFASATDFLTALLMFSLSALFGTLSMAIQGYQALTREEIAAIVRVEPAGKQQFTARFSMPDGREEIFSLAGDQLYVDAHILKWKPLANIFGLHTSYELDRVAGRYAALNDETTKVRTVHSLSKDKPLNIFDLRKRFAMLNPLLDVEYGSATFIHANSPGEFRLMVSTTGRLIRNIDKESN